ncbi:MAG TPA: carboxypeptidase regulatory-like domain-containing protein [Bryobacteraceae bacterium]|nr:carboxypeptidase regulatory-like domain-containing protein [Bryobacteraceae bacterium]
MRISRGVRDARIAILGYIKPLTTVSLLALVCLLAVSAAGQTITGSITGTVTDPSGAVVTNAKVTAINAATGVTSEAVTNEAGVYRLQFLRVGNYNLAVETTGFKKFSGGPFGLEVNQVARVDVKLEIGNTSETVEVTSVAPILQTETTATGDTITSQKLSSLPLNGRNFATMTLLIPGAISTSPGAMNTSGRFQGSGSRPQVNGNREQTNNFLLDGVDVNDSIDNRIGYQPNVDALEEVRVLTGNGGGEFGNVGGASVIMTLKGGSNEFHGNVFEFFRNEKLDANGFFRNRNANTARRNGFHRNIFGGTFGGPIVRNKAFFFVDYEGTEQRTSGPASASVAPATWRNGDLSQFLGQNQIIRDPDTGEPFSGNIIPAARIGPVARALFSNTELYPLPNQAGTGALGVTGNYGASTRSKLRNHQADAKVDWRLSDKDNLMGRWSIGRYESGTSQQPLAVQIPGITEGPTTSAVVNWTRSFSPRLVNDARISFSRIVIDDSVSDWSGLLGTNGNQTLGISGGQPIAGLSQIAFGTGLTEPGSTGNVSSTADNKFQGQTFLTYTTGGHLLKFGGQLVRMQQNRFYAGNNGVLGVFRFNGTYTGGNAFADFLLNKMAGKGRGDVAGKWGHRHWRNALFFQDDWKVKPSLTLNLGVRWEYISPIYEVADRQVNINTFTGQLLYADADTEFGRALYDPYWKSFMPNIGFAWTPPGFNNRFVIRAGYRFSTFLEGTGANLRLPLNPPFFAESDVTFDSRSPGDIRVGFSDLAVVRPTLDSPRTAAAPQLQGRAWDLNLRPQFTNQFNFTAEYMLSPSTSVTGAYVGQRGTHLVVPHEANQPLPGTGPFNTWAPLNDRRPLARLLPNVSNIALTESSGTMWYNSFQLSARQRTSHGFEFLTAYTFSKTLSDNLGYYGCGGVNSDGAYWQNAYDRRANYGPACFDARHNFTVGGLYEVPVGRGKAIAPSSRVLDLIAGGWNINYFLSAHSGFPVTINAPAHQNNTGQSVRGNVRANYYRPLPDRSRTVDRWFGPVDTLFCTANGVDNGTCSYGLPALGQFGSAGVGTERMPGFFNLDFSIGKKFHVTERQYFDFRAEAFNALNFVSWGAPARDITNPGQFGQITGQIGNPRNIQLGLKYYF